MNVDDRGTRPGHQPAADGPPQANRAPESVAGASGKGWPFEDWSVDADQVDDEPSEIGLSPQARRLYRLMTYYARLRAGHLASQAKLAEKLGLPNPTTGGARQVRRWQQQLRAAGWLEVTDRDQRRGHHDGGRIASTNVYRFAGPGSDQLATPRRPRRPPPARKPNPQVGPTGHPSEGGSGRPLSPTGQTNPQVGPTGQPVESPLGDTRFASQTRRSDREDRAVDNHPSIPLRGRNPRPRAGEVILQPQGGSSLPAELDEDLAGVFELLQLVDLEPELVEVR